MVNQFLRTRSLLLPLIIFIIFFIPSKASVASFNENINTPIIQEAEYKAGTIHTSSHWNGTRIGSGDFGHFSIARLQLISDTNPEWLHYTIEYTPYWQNPPIFVPEGDLMISRQSTIENTSSCTPNLTFLANTSKGTIINLLWLNSSIIASSVGNIWFSVPYSEAFLAYSPWRANQEDNYQVGYDEPWVPLLNFSSTYQNSSPVVQFTAVDQTLIPNGSLRCYIQLVYNISNGVLKQMNFRFQKKWNESRIPNENEVWGDVWLTELNVTGSQSNEMTSGRIYLFGSIFFFETVPLLTFSMIILVWISRRRKKR